MSTYCKHCGAKLTPGQAHDCPKKLSWNKIKVFFEKLFNKIGSNESLDDAECFERGKSIVPGTVAPDDGEVVIKQYDLAILRSRLKATKAEGKMQVTNKRILFRAAGRTPVGKTVYQSEFDIARIEGVEIRKDYRFMWLDFFIGLGLYVLAFWFGALVSGLLTNSAKPVLCILSIVLGLAASVPFYLIDKHYRAKIFITGTGFGLVMIPLVVAIPMELSFVATLGAIASLYIFVLFIISLFLSFFQPNLEVHVLASSASPAIQVIEEYSGFGEVLPGKDTDIVIKEIGAMINDIKTLGDIGIEKWQIK